MAGVSDDDILSDAKEAFELAQDVETDNRRDALDDWRFARLAEQWPEKIRRERELEGRPCLTINRLPSFIRQVVNDARQTKPGITVHPVDDTADPEVAEILNGLIRNIEQTSDAEVAYDTALECAATSGLGYFKINTRYAHDDTFDQDICVERVVNPFAIYGDPNSTAADSSDWDSAFELEVVTQKAFEKRWGEAEFSSFADDGFQDTRNLRDQENAVIASWWRREQVEKEIVALSDLSVVALKDYKANKALYDQLGVTVVGSPRTTQSYKVTQRLLSGGEVLETVDWAGKYIPIIPVYGEEFNVEGRRHFRSLVRDAKDPQRMLNYWRTTSTELVALAPKAPFIGRKGAFQTDSAKWATANTQTHAYLEYDGQERPERQPFAGVPAGAVQEAMNAQDDIKSILGIFDAALGAQGNETSGRAIIARQKEADTSNFHFIDNLSRGLRHAGRVMLDLIPHVYSVPRIVRVIGPDGSARNVPVNQPVQTPQMGPDGQPMTQPAMGPNGQPQIDPQTGQMQQELVAIAKTFDLTVGKYDVTVEAGPSFATKREELNTVLVELIRAVPQAAPALVDIIVDTFDLPDGDKVVQRLQAMLPPQAKGQDPNQAKMQQQMQTLMQQVQSLTAQNQQLKLTNQQIKDNAALQSRQLDIDQFNAQTDRMDAMAKLSQPQFPPSPSGSGPQGA